MNTLDKHEKYMSRCIYLGKNNKSKYFPNPSVGCVIVKDDIIISEGCTSAYGGNHAEVNAINNVKNKKLTYRWNNTVNGFNMPVNILIEGTLKQLKPIENWQSQIINSETIKVDTNFYVNSKRIN